MGQIFYDMGFLSTAAVHECSATDLVAGYVGQTGPKTIQLLEKALGKVLFVDEAYRLGEGVFATEAINELVDSLTKPRFAGKIVVILAGYEDNMNQLLSVNQGLSSRFPEEVIFTNLEPEKCWELLQQNLKKKSIHVDQVETHSSSFEIIYLFSELSSLPSWGNSRDVLAISDLIMRAKFRTASGSSEELTVTHQEVIDSMTKFLEERKARSAIKNPTSTQFKSNDQATQDSVNRPHAVKTTQSTKATSHDRPKKPTSKAMRKSQSSNPRDAGVTDALWNQLQADKAGEELTKRRIADAVAAAEAASRAAAAEAAALAQEVARLAVEKVRNDQLQELKRRHEAARLQELAARRAREEADERLRRARAQAEQARKEEARVQAKLRDLGQCEAGFRWIKQDGGYRCAGGAHFVTDAQLGI